MAPNLVDCIIHWKKKLEKYSDEDVQLNVIRKLSKISMTPEILEATHIGKTIRNLSEQNDVVGEKAKTLLSRWRNMFVNLESVRNSEQKNSINNKDNVEKWSSKQNLNQEIAVHNEKESSHYHKGKHKNDSLPRQSKKTSDRYLNVSNSLKSRPSLGESEMKKSHLDAIDFHRNIQDEATPNPQSLETFSDDDEIIKRKIPSLSESPTSLKRKLTTEEKVDAYMKSLPKKIKHEDDSIDSSQEKKKQSHHLNKDKSPFHSSKKQQCSLKYQETSSVKHKSSLQANKVKVHSTEEFNSASVSFEDCLGFNDIVTGKTKKRSKQNKKIFNPSSKPSSGSKVKSSVQLKNKVADKKVTVKSSPCDVNVSTKSSHFSKEEQSGSVSKKSKMFDTFSDSPLLFSMPQPIKKESLTSDDVIKFTSSRKEKTAIYSGRKNCNRSIPSLAQCCYRVLIENIDILGIMTDMPYSLLKPVLEKCTPNQLFTIERFNPHLLDDTNELWELHCKRDYKFLSPLEHETWRDVYLRGFDEHEKKLKNVTANISASMSKATPKRQVKLAFIDSFVKPPRDVLRKQAKSRLLETGANAKPGLSPKVSADKTTTVLSLPSSSAKNQSLIVDKNDSAKIKNQSFVTDKKDSVKTHDESFCTEVSSKGNFKPVAAPTVGDPTASNKEIANLALAARKPRVAPLMAKTLKAMKKCFRPYK